MLRALALVAVLTAAPAFAADPVVSQVSQEVLLERQQKDGPDLVVLDVRTPEEYAAGHVPGAVNIPYDQLAQRLTDVPKDKDVVLYCQSGRRAMLAASTLADHGYTRLGHLEGDIRAWRDNGRPVE